jgi:hypothetical protein
MEGDDSRSRHSGQSRPPPQLAAHLTPDETGGSKGWFSRGHPPHFDRAGLIQTITFRLDDSLPSDVLAERENELRSLSETEQTVEKRKRLAAYLDAGHGRDSALRP